MKKVIIYPGRFQPMLSHHATVFERLVGENPDHEVYIATSDKVEPGKSPFNYKEKQLIATGHGIDPNKVLFARSPYNNVELAKYFDEENTEIFFAVGEKDMETDPRFTFNNLDKDGINIKQNGEPYYYQMINTYKDNPMPMNKRGYIMVVPTISGEEEVASASSFRNAIKTAPNKESAREIFSKQFKDYKDNIFELVYDKIKGDKMSEDLNILRQLAGLSVSEDAPIEFKSQLKPEEIKFAPVSKSSAVMSIANRFPQGADVNDPEVKKDEFVKALVSSPVSLLSEINERIMPDENGLEVSKRLSEILDKMPEEGIASLDDNDKGFVLEIVKIALKDMELSAGDEREFDPDTSALESIDLSDVREDYGIEEQEELNEIKRNSDALFVYNDGQPLSFTDWMSEWKRETGIYDIDPKELELKHKEYVKAVKRGKDYKPEDPVQMDLGFDKDDHAKTFRKMMGREYAESKMNEGGSAADLAMTDCESWIEQCGDAEECIQGLEDLKSENPGDADESYANDIIDTYIDMVQNFGLEDVQDKLEADKNNEPDLPESDLNEFKGTSDVDLDELVADAMSMTFQEFRRVYPDYEELWYEVQKKIRQGSLADTDMYDSVDTSQFRAIVEEIQLMEGLGLLKWAGKAYKELKKIYTGLTPGGKRFVDWGAGLGVLSTGIGIVGNTIENNYKEILALILGGTAIYELIRRMGDKRETARQVAAEFDLKMKEKNLALNNQEKVEMANELKQLAYQGANESFDPQAEQSREEEAYQELVSAYDQGGEEGLCKAIGCSMEELDQEMSEWARDHNLHMDDDRDEIIHGYIEDLVDNADWKDHGGYDYDPADMEMESIDKQIAEYNELRKLSGLSTLEEQLEGIELPEDEKERGKGEKVGRHVGDLVNMGMSIGAAVILLRQLALALQNPGSQVAKDFGRLLQSPNPGIILGGIIGGGAIAFTLAHKIKGWIIRAFGGKLGKTFDIAKDTQPVMASKEVDESGCGSHKKKKKSNEGKCPKCGHKKHILRACASCGCS